MALNREYFDSIDIEVVKKKYYNMHKVQAVFDDILSQADALYREIDFLKHEVNILRESSSSKQEIADAILSARDISQKIIDEAKHDAEAIRRDAEERRDEILKETQAKQDYALSRVERCFNNMREQQLACMEALNAEWQEYLCGLEEEAEAQVEEPKAPSDLKDKVSSLADIIFSMDDI